jgi:hypothetical protein
MRLSPGLFTRLALANASAKTESQIGSEVPNQLSQMYVRSSCNTARTCCTPNRNTHTIAATRLPEAGTVGKTSFEADLIRLFRNQNPSDR